MQFVIGNRNPEARAEHLQLIFVQLFLLVSDVLAFARLAKPIALNRFCQNDRRRSCVIHRCPKRSVNFDRIVPAQPHARQLLVRKMLHHFQQSRIGAKQVLPEIRSALDKILLILAVADFTQTPHQQTVTIVLDQAVPIRCPRCTLITFQPAPRKIASSS